MTKITEQLRNGNLPEGEYYVENKNGNKATMYLWSDAKCKFVVKEAELEILAPVPSYEEWKASEKLKSKLQLKETAYDFDTARLEEENAQLKKWCEEFNALEVAKENTKLKELLSMVKPVLQLEYNVTENRNLIKKINQALGEK